MLGQLPGVAAATAAAVFPAVRPAGPQFLSLVNPVRLGSRLENHKTLGSTAQVTAPNNIQLFVPVAVVRAPGSQR